MRLLSKREKVLLYLLAVLAVCTGFFLLVLLPAQRRGSELDDQILSAQSETDNMRMLISQVDGMQNDIEEYNANIEVERALFLPLMSNNELDAFITGMIQSHGLVSQSLAISAEGSQSEQDMVQTYLINVVARGRISQFVALSETVKNTEGIRIAAISLTQTATAVPVPTAMPAPTPKARNNRNATPTPEPTMAPTPTPYDPSYSMNIAFVVVEYNEDGVPNLEENTEQPPEEEETPIL